MALGENNNMGTTMLVSPASAPMYYGNNGGGLGRSSARNPESYICA